MPETCVQHCPSESARINRASHSAFPRSTLRIHDCTGLEINVVSGSCSGSKRLWRNCDFETSLDLSKVAEFRHKCLTKRGVRALRESQELLAKLVLLVSPIRIASPRTKGIKTEPSASTCHIRFKRARAHLSLRTALRALAASGSETAFCSSPHRTH